MNAEVLIGLTGLGITILGSFIGMATMMYKAVRRLEIAGWKIEQHSLLMPYLIRGQLAALDGLKQQGCNGEVTKAREELLQKLADMEAVKG